MPAIVEIDKLKKYFPTSKGALHAVEDVSMSFEEGRTMGVVGESGCGKSTLGRTIIHLHESSGGKIYFKGEDVTSLKPKELRTLREDMQIIFQDPYSSLDPRMPVENVLKEPLILSSGRKGLDIDKEVKKLMDLTGIARRLKRAYPHELDGGLRQRVGIGRALALNPKFIVCDEPVSALDVSIQAQVLNLLMELQKELGLTYMFVTHDLSVVRHISHSISVMYLGQMVELSPSKELFNTPLHPYTKALLSAIPSIDIHNRRERQLIEGELVSPINPKPGCRFATRCPYAKEECHKPQSLIEILPKHYVACCRVEEINEELS